MELYRMYSLCLAPLIQCDSFENSSWCLYKHFVSFIIEHNYILWIYQKFIILLLFEFSKFGALMNRAVKKIFVHT